MLYSIGSLKHGEFYKMKMSSYTKGPRFSAWWGAQAATIFLASFPEEVTVQVHKKKDAFGVPRENLALTESNKLLGVTQNVYNSPIYNLPISGWQNLDMIPIPEADVPMAHRLLGLTNKVLNSGCDPEIFAVDARNWLIPAYDYLPSQEKAIFHGACFSGNSGTNLSFTDACGKAYWDGFQAEFTTKPIHCHGYMIDMVRAGLKAVLSQARIKYPRAKLSLRNVFEVSEKFRMTADPAHVALGCDPSHNAYGAVPFAADDPRSFPYRMAGGHMHFGIAKGVVKEHGTEIIKMLDLFVALPAVGLFANIDDPLRRRFYGRAGEFRTPEHGLEYRTLSNAWLGSPQIAHVLFDLARAVVDVGTRGLKVEDFGISEVKLQEIINSCDVRAARRFFKDNWDLWRVILMGVGWGNNPELVGRFKKVILHGVESAFPTYEDIAENWLLDGSWSFHSNQLRASWGGYKEPVPPIQAK